MTSNKRFSKNQRQLIKEVERLLGSTRAFYTDMTQGNHLVFLIEGVEKPMYTSGTPSDRKSYTNFISDLKRAITPVEPVELTEEEKEDQKLICTNQVMDRCILGCGQQFRQRKAELILKEKQSFALHGDVDQLAVERAELVKEQIAHQLKQRRETGLILPSMKRVLTKQVRHHLDFLLPSLSSYRHEQKVQQQEVKETAIADTNATETSLELVVNDGLSTEAATQPQAVETPSHTAAVLELCHAGGPLKTVPTNKAVKEPTKPVSKKEQLRLQAEKQREHVEALPQISSAQRISLFRSLSKTDMLGLIHDLEQAMAQNEAQAIDEILAKVKEFGLPKAQLIERLQNMK